MKKVLWIFAVGALVGLTACSIKVASGARRAPNADPLILRAHFVGTEQLFAAPESAKLKELWNLKSSDGLRAEMLNRLALLPSFWLGDSLGRGMPTLTNLFRPLLDDVLARECYLDCTAAPELLLAVRVPETRARLWQTNLWLALTNWKLGRPVAVKSETAPGFELKHTGLPGVIRCLRAGEWIVLSAGSGNFAREAEVLANIKSLGRPAQPTGAWLDGAANLARFDGWLPMLASLKNLPVAHFSVSNRADFVRTYATLNFPSPHGWKSEPWQIPTNIIHDPLVSFLAVRGVAPVLDSFQTWRDLGYKPTPSQIIGWGNSSLPYQFNYAAPSRGVLEQLKRMDAKLADVVFGPERQRLGGQRIAWDTNVQQIVWRGLPMAMPHVGVLRDSGREFLALGCFPQGHWTNRVPAELYQALNRNELVGFDFEITELRLQHWRQLYQLAEISAHLTPISTNAPFPSWLSEAAPKLGEAVTELRANSPTQMTLVRKSSLGFTASELMTLGRWLESTNFPAFGLFPAQPIRPVFPPRNAPGLPQK